MKTPTKFCKLERLMPKDLICLDFKPVATIHEIVDKCNSWEIWENDDSFIIYDKRTHKVILSGIDKHIIDFMNYDLNGNHESTD